MEQKLFIGFLIQDLQDKDLTSFSLTKRNQKEYLGIFLGNKPNFHELLQAKKRLLHYFSSLIQEKDLLVFTQIFLC